MPRTYLVGDAASPVLACYTRKKLVSLSTLLHFFLQFLRLSETQTYKKKHAASSMALHILYIIAGILYENNAGSRSSGLVCRVQEDTQTCGFSTVVCVCVFSSHSFWASSSLDVPAGVTQEEGHTGFFIHLLSAVSMYYAINAGRLYCTVLYCTVVVGFDHSSVAVCSCSCSLAVSPTPSDSR